MKNSCWLVWILINNQRQIAVYRKGLKTIAASDIVLEGRSYEPKRSLRLGGVLREDSRDPVWRVS